MKLRQKPEKPKPPTPAYPLTLIGIDPGVTTGVAVFKLDSADSYPEYLEHYQWGSPDTVFRAIDTLRKKHEDQCANVWLIIEQFDKRPGVIDPDFTPKFVNRDIENNIFDIPIIWQIPAKAKHMIPEGRRGAVDALKRLGWFTSANKHANDAARHVATYLVNDMLHMPTIRKGWPEP